MLLFFFSSLHSGVVLKFLIKYEMCHRMESIFPLETFANSVCSVYAMCCVLHIFDGKFRGK